ncbi:hypothetical protein B0A48_02969 [Cryoendolithus antarcticus]|uniref:Xylanolytic transcriptional activator regulatory domain-containing protein n=1 Tax=Cryoendolithus antarcticus TaxID=1507870 RepID=A0A1V8TLR8_9PEZI|nr:hypothetical protein B0A48_02969 [Cryoendolithus antarcticus]
MSSSEGTPGMLHADQQPPAKRIRLNAPLADQGRHREIGLMRWRSEKDAASFVGSASGIHFIRSVYSAVEAEKSRAASPVQSPDRNLVPGEDDQLPGENAEKPQGLWQSSEVTLTTNGRNNSVSFDDLLAWSDSYFENWHKAYPFLHAPSVLESFRRVATRPLGDVYKVDPLDLAIMRSIFSISLADRRQSGDKGVNRPWPAELVFQDFDSAIESIQFTLAAATTIKALQAVVSVQLFLVSMLRHNAASRLGGLAVRMAFQIGLHRCPVRYNSFTADDIQLRKRVFFCVYCIDRHLCQSLGLPLTIRDDDVDLCLPNEEKHTSVAGITIATDDRLALLSLLARHAEIRGLIMELCNKHECTISLNRPLLALPKDTSDYKAALQSCISAARSIIALLYDDLKGTTAMHSSSNGYSTLTTHALLWPSFTWATWQSAFIILYAAVEGELPKDSAMKLADHSGDILKHIALRGGVWPTACAAAISDLRKHLDRPRSSLRPRDQKPLPSMTAAAADISTEQANRLTALAGVAETHGRPWMQQSQAQSISAQYATDSGADNSGVHGLILPEIKSIENMPYPNAQSVSLPAMIPAINVAFDPNAPYRQDYGNVGAFGPALNAPGTFVTDAVFDMNDPELFNGFDIPFWLDDMQYDSIFNDGS